MGKLELKKLQKNFIHVLLYLGGLRENVQGKGTLHFYRFMFSY